MEIKKFEAYNYRGPELTKVSREQFIHEFVDLFMEQKICGYEINGTTYNSNFGELWLHCDKQNSDEYKIIKLDLSDMGIEIGSAEWNDDTEEFDEFIPEVNLDTNITKQIKSYKKNIGKYNL